MDTCIRDIYILDTRIMDTCIMDIYILDTCIRVKDHGYKHLSYLHHTCMHQDRGSYIYASGSRVIYIYASYMHASGSRVIYICITHACIWIEGHIYMHHTCMYQDRGSYIYASYMHASGSRVIYICIIHAFTRIEGHIYIYHGHIRICIRVEDRGS